MLPPSPSSWGNTERKISPQKSQLRTSLMAQWIRILLPVPGTRVGLLIQEDPACCRATKPVCHNQWGCSWSLGATATEPTCRNYWNPPALEPRLQNQRSQGNVKPENRKEEQTPLPQLKKSLSSARKTQSTKNKLKIPVVDSCWCMAKPIQYCKVISL